MSPKTLSVSEARQRLPSLLQDLTLHPDHVFHISVRNRMVAELRSAPQAPRQGSAVKELLRLAKKFKRFKGKRVAVSENVKKYLYL